ncbi:hypothetical protein HGRIS_008808 [Hohenbuehelia grisea]|uniref:Cleavage stimulation factor subunit 2 hinge domain-containing protein n=1 Tax=Hohenbuehelia grisea TaxID=104357 RepID=A0ABR3J962_9AGAR
MVGRKELLGARLGASPSDSIVSTTMSDQSLATEQLLELLLHLKKAGPDAAKQILNSQPQIAYALITLMVNMNAINFEVFQKTLASFGGNNQDVKPAAPLPSAIPPHLAQAHAAPHYRTSTPPAAAVSAPPHSGTNGHGFNHVPSQPGYGRPPPAGPSYAQPTAAHGHHAGYPPHVPPYGHAPPAAPSSAPASNMSDSLAGMSDEQKAMLTRVISMTPEQISMLPPADRANIIQLRTTLGLPS